MLAKAGVEITEMPTVKEIAINTINSFLLITNYLHLIRWLLDYIRPVFRVTVFVLKQNAAI
jgi:hypothetical protein